MFDVEIRRPRVEDSATLHQFFRIVMEDTFAKEGISHLLEEMENEITTKKHYLQCNLNSDGKDRYFLLAVDKKCNEIIGTIEYGRASDLIIQCTGGALKELYEIGTVFVHPYYQRQGIGTLLLNEMFLTLMSRGINEFCLDSGYGNAQKVWKKKFGEPDYLLKDYWGVGNDHMIWRKDLKHTPIVFSR